MVSYTRARAEGLGLEHDAGPRAASGALRAPRLRRLGLGSGRAPRVPARWAGRRHAVLAAARRASSPRSSDVDRARARARRRSRRSPARSARDARTARSGRVGVPRSLMLGFGLRLDTAWQGTRGVAAPRRRCRRRRRPLALGARPRARRFRPGRRAGDNARRPRPRRTALRNALRLTRRHRRLARVPLLRDARHRLGRASAASSPARGPSGCAARGCVGLARHLRPRAALARAPPAARRRAALPGALGDGDRLRRRASVLPFRLGELVRPALLARRIGFGMSAALSSVVLERLFDMLFVIGCFLAVSLIYPVPARPAARRRSLLGGAGDRRVRVLLLVTQRNRARAERSLDAAARPAARRASGRRLAAARRGRSSTGSARSPTARTVAPRRSRTRCYLWASSR